MAKYIKANPLVAKYLKLDKERNTVKDGNFLLWQGDMTAFGKLTDLYGIAARIGGLVLEPYEARQEQDGSVTRPLPQATDERFKTVSEDVSEDKTGANPSDNIDGEETASKAVDSGVSDTDDNGESEKTDETAATDAEKGE